MKVSRDLIRSHPLPTPRDFDAFIAALHQRTGGVGTRAAAHLTALQSQLEAIARRDVAAVLATATDDVTLEFFAPPELPFVRVARGHQALLQALESNFDAVGDQRPTLLDVFAEGDRVVLFGRETGYVKATGLHYEIEFVQRFTFRDDRLASVQIIAAHAKPQGD